MKQELLNKIGDLIEGAGYKWTTIVLPDEENEPTATHLAVDKDAYAQAIAGEIAGVFGVFPASLRDKAVVTLNGYSATLQQFCALTFAQVALRRLEEAGLTETALYKEIAEKDRKIAQIRNPDGS